MNNVLVISVHADDEILGCGATLVKHKRNGDTLHWLLVTHPTINNGYPQEFCDTREDQIKQIETLLGFKSVTNLYYPPAKLTDKHVEALVGDLSKAIHNIKPNIIYMPNRSDIHTDHQISAKAILGATKSFRAPASIKKILMMEVISETEQMPMLPETTFVPNVYSTFNKLILAEKMNLWNIYAKTEGQKYPLPREFSAVEALARYRGTSVGAPYAEAFMLVRETF